MTDFQLGVGLAQTWGTANRMNDARAESFMMCYSFMLMKQMLMAEV